jgi:arylsulfatase A-like enzyme
MSFQSLQLLPLLLLLLPRLFQLTVAETSSDEGTSVHHPPPNIVVLFADNLGYDDIGVYQQRQRWKTPGGSSGRHPRSPTPNIDRLGHEGKVFYNWNSAAALCSASRAALLTGKYPVRTGVYPRVFKPGAVHGLMPNETTLGNLLQKEGYATAVVGKWHLGHRHPYLPTTHHGFDEWIGIPYHMSGGSVEGHVCHSDANETMWLPLYRNDRIVQQPVHLQTIATTYVDNSVRFIDTSIRNRQPFFLYLAFSHVHQLCAPRDFPEQLTCQWSSERNATFATAVEEMDWIAGKVLDSLDADEAVKNNTLVIFTSDNGPWVAEQACAGSKGPFQGEWLKRHAHEACTACPHDYIPSPTPERPRRCVLPGVKELNLDGVHCGEDTGLGGVWEANMRMPAIARFPGRIEAGSETDALVSTLDVLPTVMSTIRGFIPDDLDGKDISKFLYQEHENDTAKDDYNNRMLFYWRDGFQDGPLPPPFGRFDVAAVRYGNLKAWFWTKSAHYNQDIEQYHDPPLLFDVMSDPAESTPLDPSKQQEAIQTILEATRRHKETVDWMQPLALATDPKYIPCVDPHAGCRTDGATMALEASSAVNAEISYR